MTTPRGRLLRAAALFSTTLLGLTGGSSTLAAGRTSPFYIHAHVAPTSVRNHSRVTLSVRAVRGARCAAAVIYSAGAPPNTLHPARTAGRSGVVRWSWRVSTARSVGIVTVTCRIAHATASTMITFRIRH